MPSIRGNGKLQLPKETAHGFGVEYTLRGCCCSSVTHNPTQTLPKGYSYPRHMFLQREGGPISISISISCFFFSALVSFICYYLLCQISNTSSFFFPFPSLYFFLSLPCYCRAHIKDAAAHWVTQSVACQAAGHEVT